MKKQDIIDLIENSNVPETSSLLQTIDLVEETPELINSLELVE